MNNNKIVVSMNEMIPIIIKAIENNGIAEMTVTGNSMLPLLKNRVSSVKLAKAENLKTGNIVLFKTIDERYILHRITAVSNDLYEIVGDNQYIPDKNIPKNAIIAKVIAYNRNGKCWKNNDTLYRCFLPAIKNIRYYREKIKKKLLLFIRKN